jgi:hypothetical protein
MKYTRVQWKISTSGPVLSFVVYKTWGSKLIWRWLTEQEIGLKSSCHFTKLFSDEVGSLSIIHWKIAFPKTHNTWIFFLKVLFSRSLSERSTKFSLFHYDRQGMGLHNLCTLMLWLWMLCCMTKQGKRWQMELRLVIREPWGHYPIFSGWKEWNVWNVWVWKYCHKHWSKWYDVRNQPDSAGWDGVGGVLMPREYGNESQLIANKKKDANFIATKKWIMPTT